MGNELIVDGKEVWDNTKFQAYACGMRGKLGYEEHLVSNDTAEALVFGAAMHKAAEEWTNARINGWRDIDAVEEGHRAFELIWNAGVPEDVRAKLEIDGNRRSIRNFQRLFKGYRERFPFESYTRVLGCEIPFTFSLGTTPQGREVWWSGILDRVVERMEEIYYRELKTTSYTLDSDFFDQFRLSGQLTGQVWAGQQQFGTQFAGAVVEGIKVEAPLKTKVRQASELASAEVVDITQEAIEEWKRDVLQGVDDIHVMRERQHWRMNRGDLCKQFHGGCSMRKICTALPSARAGVKAQYYHERVWNPITRDGGE